MSRRPIRLTELPGPKARDIIQRSEGSVSPSYTRDYPLVAERGEGCWVIDPDGNSFLDMTAGIAVNSTGHCHPEVVEAIREQAGKLIHMSGTDFYYPVQSRLAATLAKLAPIKGGDARVYFGNSGTEATEAAIKLARYHTGRANIIGFFHSFHGRTLGALSLTSSKVRQRERFAPLVPGFHHVPYPDPYRGGTTAATLEAIQRLFETVLPVDEVAAIVVEPIQGEGGYVVPPDDFLPALRALCDAHGILLVFDEVQSGMGRTGKLWACEHVGVKPDILNSAKGIASGMPLSATFASRAVMSWLPGAHASTFGGNPISCAASLKTIELLQGGLIENADRVGAHLQRRLVEVVGDNPHVGQVRGRGLMVGVELVQDRTSKVRAAELRNRIVLDAFERGLLILGAGPNTIRFCPALVLNEAEADVAVEIFAASLKACA